MKSSTVTILCVSIIATVVLVIGVCWMGTFLMIDSNTQRWEPVPGTTTYDWQ